MLRESIDRILKEYKIAQAETFASHPLAKVLRTDLPTYLRGILGDPGRYLTKEVPGKATRYGVPGSPSLIFRLPPLLKKATTRFTYFVRI